jgi:hypothetical protein
MSLCTPKYTQMCTPNFNRLYTPSLLDLPSQLYSQDAFNYTLGDASRMLPFALDGIFPAYLSNSHKYAPKMLLSTLPNILPSTFVTTRTSRLYASIYVPGYLIQRLAELQVPDTGRWVAGDRWQWLISLHQSISFSEHYFWCSHQDETLQCLKVMLLSIAASYPSE